MLSIKLWRKLNKEFEQFSENQKRIEKTMSSMLGDHGAKQHSRIYAPDHDSQTNRIEKIARK